MQEYLLNYQPAPMCLDGKVILVTGAGSGIGQAAARTYAQNGAEVILVGRTTEKLEQTYDEMLAGGCREPIMYTFDLASTDETAYRQLADAVSEQYHRLDGLLHNASLLGERKPIENYSAQVWQDVMQVNVNSAFLLSKALLPTLKLAKNASLLFTSSGVGRRGKAYWGAYAASKFATEGLMQVLASELENTSNIRVNSINPGATCTAMRQAAYPAENPDDNPHPEEIMLPYLYLMDDASCAVNGMALNAQ